MEPEIVVAVLSMCGTAVGNVAGVITVNKLTNYRTSQPEKEVERHNNLCEKMIIAEQSPKSAHRLLAEMIGDKE